MAMGKPNPEWQNKVKEWQASGKSMKAWCREQNIPITTFHGWKQRFKTHNQTSILPNKQQFIELKDKPATHPGIILEFQEVKIHLTVDFNSALLKRCVAALRGDLC